MLGISKENAKKGGEGPTWRRQGEQEGWERTLEWRRWSPPESPGGGPGG
jgi:hypothetical protein